MLNYCKYIMSFEHNNTEADLNSIEIKFRISVSKSEMKNLFR